MSTKTTDQQRQIEEARRIYNEYLEKQKNFQAPQAHIQIDTEDNGAAHVHIDVEHRGTQYHFRSIEEKDTQNIYQYLYSQPLVRAKYAAGSVASLEATTNRCKTLINRFEDKTCPLYLYSGFIVSDAQTDTFLGFANIGAGPNPHLAEIAFINRAECWSRPPDSVINYTGIDNHETVKKAYSGIGTVEVCTLLQYAALLKQRDYRINGHSLQAVVAYARLDNEGSWKSIAKGGMFVEDVEVVPHYSSDLRYRLRKDT